MPANMRLAIIDVGTLKSKFEIREFTPDGKNEVVYRDKKLTVMGRDLHKTGNRITDESVQTTIDALQDFQQKMQEYDVIKHKAVATEALRKAINATEVLAKIQEVTGIELEILDHDGEAKIFFMHIAKSFPGKRIAVADIGGGSVQLVIGRDHIIEHAYLFKTGAYYMQEELSKTHHPTPAEVATAKQYVTDQFAALRSAHLQVNELIYGSTNIIDFMQAMEVSLEDSGYEPPHNFRAQRNDLKKVFDRIVKLSYEDRMPLFPTEPYYMWSAENALLNVFGFMDALGVSTTIPTNENISSGLFDELYESVR